MHRTVIWVRAYLRQRCRCVLLGDKKSSRRQGAGRATSEDRYSGDDRIIICTTISDSAAVSPSPMHGTRPQCVAALRSINDCTEIYALIHASALFEAPVLGVVIRRSTSSDGRCSVPSAWLWYGSDDAPCGGDWRRQALQDARCVGNASQSGIADSKTLC